jgi:hypothetical protein
MASSIAFNNAIIVGQILHFLEDDRATMGAAMLPNHTTAALARPRVWRSPSLGALARVPAEHRANITHMVRKIELNAAVARSTIVALSRAAFPRLQTLLVDDPHAGVSLAWHDVKALEELIVLDRVRSPAVHAALGLLPENTSSLGSVYLRCAVTVDELAQLACMGRLRRLKLLGELPSSTSIHSVAEKLTETVDALQSMPFAKLTETTLVGHAKKIFAMLKLLTVAAATTATTTTTPTKAVAAAMAPSSTDCICGYVNLRFNDNASVDLAAIVAAYGMSNGNGDMGGTGGASSSFRPRTLLPLTELHLAFPLIRKVLAKHLLTLEQLPPTLRSLDIDACRPLGHATTPTTGLTDADFVKLVARQPHLNSLRFMLAAPRLTVAALSGLGASCRRLHSLAVAGAFELEKLALPVPAAAAGTNTDTDTGSSGGGDGSSGSGGGGDDHKILFPELRMLVVGGTRPDHDFGLVTPSHAHRPLSTLCTRAHGKVKEQLQQGDERAGRRTLTHLLRHAPRLAKLLLIDGYDGHGVSGVMNRLWCQMHPDGSPAIVYQNQVG